MKRFITYKRVFAVFLALYLFSAFSGNSNVCQASASATDLNYCFVTDIAVTNDGAAALTDYPVRVLMPASSMISANQLDPRGWDAYPILGTADNELPLTVQSLTSNAAPWWTTLSIPAGATRTIQLYTGKDDIRRANGFRFTGREEVAVTGSNNTRCFGGPNCTWTVELVNHDATPRTETIFDHYATSPDPNGFKAEFIDQTTHMDLQFSFADNLGPNADTCAITWNNDWNDEVQVFDFIYRFGGLVEIVRNGVSATTCAHSVLLSSPTITTYVGRTQADTQNLTGASINRLLFVDSFSSAFGYDAQFNANGLTETNSINPYSGTVTDEHGSETITYTIDADQTAIDFSVSVIAPNLFDNTNVPTEGNSVVGAPVTSGFENARPTVSTGPFRSFIVDPLNDTATATGAPSQGVAGAFFWGISFLLAAIIFVATRGYMPAAILALGTGPTIGVILGVLPEWWLIIWGLLIAVTWFAHLQSQAE